MNERDAPFAPKAPRPWYSRGLRFTCTRCRACCGGAPGYVWVNAAEIGQIASFLGMPEPEFREAYCRHAWWRVSLKELADGDCVFLGPDGCTIYPVRPRQCRSFPFWEDNLGSPRDWERVKCRCPGVGQGKLRSAAEIERILRGDATT